MKNEHFFFSLAFNESKTILDCSFNVRMNNFSQIQTVLSCFRSYRSHANRFFYGLSVSDFYRSHVINELFFVICRIWFRFFSTIWGFRRRTLLSLPRWLRELLILQPPELFGLILSNLVPLLFNLPRRKKENVNYRYFNISYYSKGCIEDQKIKPTWQNVH